MLNSGTELEFPIENTSVESSSNKNSKPLAIYCNPDHCHSFSLGLTKYNPCQTWPENLKQILLDGYNETKNDSWKIWTWQRWFLVHLAIRNLNWKYSGNTSCIKKNVHRKITLFRKNTYSLAGEIRQLILMRKYAFWILWFEMSKGNRFTSGSSGLKRHHLLSSTKISASAGASLLQKKTSAN